MLLRCGCFWLGCGDMEFVVCGFSAWFESWRGFFFLSWDGFHGFVGLVLVFLGVF